MPSIKTLIFDLGNVIVPFDFHRGYSALEKQCRYSSAEIPERLRTTDLVMRLESGTITPEDFVAGLSALLEYGGNYEEFCEIWSSIFMPGTLVPEEWIESLKGRYRLLVLSNTNAIHFEMVRRNYSVLRHFDHLVLSHEVGAMKPSPAIYQAALEHAQAAPNECFFTDDVIENVEGARREGIDAEQFVGHERLVDDLRARGVPGRTGGLDGPARSGN